MGQNRFSIGDDVNGRPLVEVVRQPEVSDAGLVELLLDFIESIEGQASHTGEDSRGRRHLRLVRTNDEASELTPLDTLLFHYFGPDFRAMLKDPAAFSGEADDELARLRLINALQIPNRSPGTVDSTAGR